MHKLLLIALTLPVSLLASDIDFFKSSYDEARAQFKNMFALQVNATGIRLKQLEFFDPQDRQLTTDIAWVQASKPNNNLIVVVSGLHGIEGFAGSAIQSRMLNNLRHPLLTDYLFVHALNPFGFKNFRRVDRFNVDLNRNFVLNKPDFTPANTGYEKLNSFLNPTNPAGLSLFNHAGFILSSIKLILQYSLDTVRQSILIGQHQFPKGLYYGGNDYQYQRKIIDQLHANIFKNYENIVVVDLHTGYGQKNKLHILANSKSQPSATDLKNIFSEERIDFGDQKNFYKVSGDLVSYLESKSNLQQKIIAVVFEYGTLDSQKTLGSIESLRRMVLENQKFQFGSVVGRDGHEIDYLFKNMFYPEDSSWRQSAILQTDMEIKRIETYLQNQ